MPNWCNNNLILSGNLKELEKVQKDIEKGDFFNSILPIPTELADTQSPARDETQEQKDKNKALEEKYRIESIKRKDDVSDDTVENNQFYSDLMDMLKQISIFIELIASSLLELESIEENTSG